ncbi:sensor histidine kinase [Paraflavitalea sp. CAU 1676]|uniref:sensor histidine kinase n=1 Tax=Paraflavitalea sp. CAU 1676 TaxID=3032598 RepID=UPI0023DCD292|nr:sensor histidine kinase [Paraflavitalea sp. CAU 1676]MDF2190749.1 histidine kinase [Paraflavitalea sp. CAU 1676]
MPAAERKPDPHCTLRLPAIKVATRYRISIGHQVLLLFFISLPFRSLSQEYNYVHYDTRDGLAGSTVYDMCQDKDGFIWFATEAGLSRFDGTRFKNFTTADGLPEVEIIKLYADHKGRVWIAPFKNTVCYYYQGKIHTAENDSLLRLVKMNAIAHGITGDADGNIYFTGSQFGYILQTQPGREKFFDLSQYNRHFKSGMKNFGDGKGLLLNSNDSNFLLKDGTLQYFMGSPNKRKEITTYLTQDKSYYKIPFTETEYNSHLERIDSNKAFMMVLLGTNDGALMIDTVSHLKFTEKFLPGKRVNIPLIDFEKNIWFGTAGEGAYKLVSRNFKTYAFSNSKTAEIFTIEKQGNKVLAGSGNNKLYEVEGANIKPFNFSALLQHAARADSGNRLLAIKKTKKGNIILLFDLFTIRRSPAGDRVNYLFSAKSVAEGPGDTLLIGTGSNVVRVRESDLQILDTIWQRRSTLVAYYDGLNYVGNVDGLYTVSKNKSINYLGDRYPALRYRIAAFAQPADGSLWVATYGGGLLGFKGGRLISHLTVKQGLLSDICRTLFAQDEFLWLGTDKGMSKINLRQPGIRLRHYTVADGLPSNMINAIYVDGSEVHIGSPAGLTTFDESQVTNFSRSELRLLDVSFSGKSMPLQPSYELDHNDNNLRVEFAGISYKSGGDMMYRYRLSGLRDVWDSTRQNILEYPSLPPGDYKLELIAVNKFGIVSQPIVLSFLVKAAFWQTWWFIFLMVGLTIGLTTALVAWRFNLVRRREKEKASLQERVHKLEQLALLSQMNPHFIFNCLNSIQNFIIKNELETTNQYLTELAHLIRQTMDCAEKGSISIRQEIKYLTRYIELERMRFGKSFDYSITCDEQVDKDSLLLPSMILQPYVENSIRHGIRHKKEGRGMIGIKFKQYGARLLCIVDDNGIGRESARRLRSQIHVEYQSKGMTLAAERIQALNRQYGEKVTIDIIDKVDEQGNPTGTRIEINFPYQMLSKLS